MEQYILKSALKAELEKLMHEANQEADIASTGECFDEKVADAKYQLCKQIRDSIDSLEVKEVDLENSMVCKVDWYDGFLLDYTQEQQDELLEKMGADVGDKIRVILIKE